MRDGYWFAPETEENSFLNSFALGKDVTVEVRIAKNVYRNDSSGYSVYEVENSAHRWFKVSGFFPTEMSIDTYYIIEGTVKKGRFGRELSMISYKSALPQTKEGILTVLRTLPRLDTRAQVVYETLGPQALKLILEDPEEVVRQVKGVGIKLANRWQESLRNVKESDIVLQTLKDYKIPQKAAKQLIEKYPDILERLQSSPYFLIEEVQGFSFLKCDKIALDNGYPVNGQERLQQAMLYVLENTCFSKGDCYMDYPSFLGELRKVVDIRIDFRCARTLLKDTNEILTYQYGSREFSVNRAALYHAFQEWKVTPTQAPFFYTCERICDEDLDLALSVQRSANKIVIEEDRVYPGDFYQAEETVSRRLIDLSASEYGQFGITEVTAVMDQVCKEEGVSLEEKQKEAVLSICRARGGVFVLNGQAGCGKTFTLNIIIKVLLELYAQNKSSFSAQIMAPTGKAAQVAHKATGLPASTIHRALHLGEYNRKAGGASLHCDCIVIDEFSMVGIKLAATLLEAVSLGTKVVIMGDHEQLPSIESGNVLYDIISSGRIPVITLNVVKRQGDGSGIIYNANQILKGEMIRSQIRNNLGIQNNAYLFSAKSPQACSQLMLGAIIKAKNNGYSMDDIQVLCPQKKTAVGVDSMNYFIQDKLNPPGEKKEVFNKVVVIQDEDGEEKRVKLMFREGDKVIQTVNDYQMKFYDRDKNGYFTENLLQTGIVNGETGRIAKIEEVKMKDSVHHNIYVKFGELYAKYEDDWSDLSLAYAITVHRAQGSQWPIIIAPIMMCNRIMLTRSLFYTLYTRAQDTSLIYCSKEALSYAIQNNITSSRKTWLKQRLENGV